MRTIAVFLMAGSLVLAIGLLSVGCENGEFGEQEFSPETDDMPPLDQPFEQQEEPILPDDPPDLEPPQGGQQPAPPQF